MRDIKEKFKTICKKIRSRILSTCASFGTRFLFLFRSILNHYHFIILLHSLIKIDLGKHFQKLVWIASYRSYLI